MRLVLLLALVACGGPAFVPVTFTMTDELNRYGVYVVAEKKLNPQCASNCDLAKAIEDGGCSEIRFRPTYSCTPGGGLFAPFLDAVFPGDGGIVTAGARMVATGATVRTVDLDAQAGFPDCSGSVEIVGPATVRIERTTSSCAVTIR